MKLTFTDEVWIQLLQWRLLCSENHVEAGGIGIISLDDENSTFIVEKVFLPSQTVTGATYEFEGTELATIMDEADDDGELHMMRFSFHYHPGSSFFSEPDKKNIDEWGVESSTEKVFYLVSAVFPEYMYSQKIEARIDFYRPRAFVENVEVMIPNPRIEVTKIIEDHFLDNVKRKQYPVQTWDRRSDYGYYGHQNMFDDWEDDDDTLVGIPTFDQAERLHMLLDDLDDFTMTRWLSNKVIEKVKKSCEGAIKRYCDKIGVATFEELYDLDDPEDVNEPVIIPITEDNITEVENQAAGD
jgi:hypothetical protein